MSHRLKQLRKLNLQAFKHNHHHSKLKHLMGHAFAEEKKYWPLVLGIALVVISVLTWSHKSDFKDDLYPVAPTTATLYTNGYQQGILSSQNLGKSKPGDASEQNDSFPPTTAQPMEGLANSLVSYTLLSKGGAAGQIQTRLLQKSILTTFYLGETTNVIEGVLENDTRLLNEIENALSVELFQYLGQSVNRADDLQNYLNLLNILDQKASARQKELTSTINFLRQNIQVQEQIISTHESSFFTQLDQAIKPDQKRVFTQSNGAQSAVIQGELDAFVQMQKDQAEAKAKAGAYESLRNYYVYYQPILQGRIEAISANRDALIAGVKVVDIPDVDLGLIVKP